MSALRVWTAGDPFAVEDLGSPVDQLKLIDVIPVEIAIGSARVDVVTSEGAASSGETGAPGKDASSTETLAFLHRKWDEILGLVPAEVEALATAAMCEGPTLSKLREVLT